MFQNPLSEEEHKELVEVLIAFNTHRAHQFWLAVLVVIVVILAILIL